MAKPYLSVIIPAYNEAARLPMTLIDIDKHLLNNNFSYEIIVVNDGSTDATSEIIKRFSLLIPNFKLINIPFHQGRGEAMRQGMFAAKGNWRLLMDADNSISIVEFNKMIPYFSSKDGYEIVIASRSVRHSRVKTRQPLVRFCLTKIGNWLSRFLLLGPVYDPQCGFKCFSETAAKKIFPLTKIKDWAFDVEVLALARKFGYKIKELPIFWTYGFRSKKQIKDYFKFFKDIFRIRYWLLRNKYQIK